MVYKQFHVDAEIHKRAKIEATIKGMSIKDYVEDLILKDLKKD